MLKPYQIKIIEQPEANKNLLEGYKNIEKLAIQAPPDTEFKINGVKVTVPSSQSLYFDVWWGAGAITSLFLLSSFTEGIYLDFLGEKILSTEEEEINKMQVIYVIEGGKANGGY